MQLRTRTGFATLVFIAVTLLGAAALADSVPDWVTAASRQTVPPAFADAGAVVLLEDTTLNVRENGEIYESKRRVMKIQHQSGRAAATEALYTSDETKITTFRGWSIAPSGKEYALKEKDALEKSLGSLNSGILYDDTRWKTMTLPGADPGAFVAFETEQRVRPYIRQHTWWYQWGAPVLRSVFTLRLPPSWEYNYHAVNWAEVKPERVGANDWKWEVRDIPELREERSMPAMQAIAGRMILSFYSPDSKQPEHHVTGWEDVSRWAYGLNADRFQSSPEIKQRVAEIVQGKTGTLEKMRAIASAIQRDIRYVAIEIGIGGYQPHPAASTFAHKYGDCKDKATLMATMLKEIGVDSYNLLVNTERGIALPEAPSARVFNHEIIAIRLPKDVDTAALPAVVDDPDFGKLLIFDPTDQWTPLGTLGPDLQQNYVLIIAPEHGKLIKTPLLAPPLNRLLRTGKLELLPDGTLSGDIQEVRTGHQAWQMRLRLLYSKPEDRAKIFEEFLSAHVSTAQLLSASVDNLSKYDEPLVVHYRFRAPAYATVAGDLLLVRPRVLGSKMTDVAEDKTRKYPVVFDDATSVQGDIFEIKLPAGFAVDELPKATSVKYPFAEYSSTIEAKDNVLKYSRSYTVKDVMVPLSQMADLRAFMREVTQDEQGAAVLKKGETK